MIFKIVKSITFDCFSNGMVQFAKQIYLQRRECTTHRITDFFPSWQAWDKHKKWAQLWYLGETSSRGGYWTTGFPGISEFAQAHHFKQMCQTHELKPEKQNAWNNIVPMKGLQAVPPRALMVLSLFSEGTCNEASQAYHPDAQFIPSPPKALDKNLTITRKELLIALNSCFVNLLLSVPW